MIYLPGVTTTSGITVGNSSAIVFTQIVQQATGSSISLNTTNGQISIADTGFFQITFGVTPNSTTTTSTSQFQLQLAGASGVIQQIMEFKQPANAASMVSMTTIVRITTNPTVVTVVNTSGGTRTISNISRLTTGAPAAYVNIIQLQ
jgi:hypothetical protein